MEICCICWHVNCSLTKRCLLSFDQKYLKPFHASHTKWNLGEMASILFSKYNTTPDVCMTERQLATPFGTVAVAGIRLGILSLSKKTDRKNLLQGMSRTKQIPTRIPNCLSACLRQKFPHVLARLCPDNDLPL